MTALARRAFVLGTATLLGCGRRTRPASSGPAARIASETIPSDEVLWALGADVRSRVIAVSPLVDDPRYSTIPNLWPKAVPRAPIASEALLALEPDLVIVADFTATDTLALLRGAGVGLLELSRFDGFEDHRRHVREIAAAVGETPAGESLVEAFDRRLAVLRAPAAARRPTVLSLNEGNVAGNHTTFADIADAAGLRNVAGDAGIEGHARVSVEQIVAWDPEVLVVPCGADDGAEVVRRIVEAPGLSATRAARSGHIVPVPSPLLYSAGAAMLDVVERLRSAVEGAI